tara:strand:+ start:228 stop:470 length:243 start_codon:yes stop_codon:yes gene_type:complete
MLIDHELITFDEKFIFAERAFMAHSAAQWAMEKIARNEFSQKQIDNFGKILMMYLKGRIDLSWQNGLLALQTLEEESPNV